MRHGQRQQRAENREGGFHRARVRLVLPVGNVGAFCAHPMNRALLLLLSFAVSTYAQDSLLGRRLTEFQDDDITLVLRTLARQENIKLVVAGELTGTVTLRAENKTSREVFDMIADAKNLVVNERDGVLYVRGNRLEQFLSNCGRVLFGKPYVVNVGR